MKALQFLALGLLITARSLAQEATPNDPAPAPAKPVETPPAAYNSSPMVRVDVLMLSVPEEKLLPMLPQLRDPDQILKAEQTLLAMVASRDATLESWPEVTTFHGVSAISESIVEHRYPVEYQPAGVPACLPSAGTPAPTESSPAEKMVSAQLSIGQACPTTFETRNLGGMLQVDPYIAPDGKSVTLTLTPQLVRFERYADFPAGVAANGQKLSVQQPIFATSKISTSLTLRDGERRLLFLGKSNEDKKQFEVFILGAKIFPGVPAKR